MCYLNSFRIRVPTAVSRDAIRKRTGGSTQFADFLAEVSFIVLLLGVEGGYKSVLLVEQVRARFYNKLSPEVNILICELLETLVQQI